MSWEDPEVDKPHLQIGNDDVVLSPCSGGCNLFDMLLQSETGHVHGVDINPYQVYLVELKKVAIQHLPYEDVWMMFGQGRHPQMKTLFETNLKPFLSQGAIDFWQEKLYYFDWVQNQLLLSPTCDEKKICFWTISYASTEPLRPWGHGLGDHCNSKRTSPCQTWRSHPVIVQLRNPRRAEEIMEGWAQVSLLVAVQIGFVPSHLMGSSGCPQDTTCNDAWSQWWNPIIFRSCIWWSCHSWAHQPELLLSSVSSWWIFQRRKLGLLVLCLFQNPHFCICSVALPTWLEMALISSSTAFTGFIWPMMQFRTSLKRQLSLELYWWTLWIGCMKKPLKIWSTSSQIPLILVQSLYGEVRACVHGTTACLREG